MTQELLSDEYEERCAIMQFDGGMTREQAQIAARADVWIKSKKP